MQAKASSLEDHTKKTISQRQYLMLAIPLIISGISTPILGAVDTAVIGRMPEAAAIGGVAIGAVIFNTMYWLLGFLRVSTSGFTAQAGGANDYQEMMLSFIRPLILAFLFGFFFIVFQQPIIRIALSILGGSETVSSYAESYFSIRIWGAPFALINYVIVGWLIGMGRVRLSLVTQIVMNVLNIILDLVFVLGLDMGIKGVASATLIAEISAVILGIGLIFYTKEITFSSLTFSRIIETSPLMRMVKVNSDLFLRTICLLIMTGIFTAKGASMGEVTLAANAILLQIHYIMAYLFGGFANASSILIGRAIGGKNHHLYRQAFKFSAQWGMGSAIVMALAMLLVGQELLSFFTTIPEVRVTASTFLMWMVLFPIVGFWGLQLEGIFSGATEAKAIRDSIFYALIVFLLMIWLLVPIYLNHGIWFAFVIFSLSRSVFLSLFIPKLNRTLSNSDGS